MMRRAAVGLVVLSIVAVATGRSQMQTPTAPQTPTFRASVDYIEVDARVLDRAGRFVRDLDADDFELFEDGRPQQIAAFTRVDIPAPSVSVQSEISSNEYANEQRVYVVLLDDVNTDARWSESVRQAARQFIARSVGATDLVAVATTGGRDSSARMLTRDTSRALTAINTFLGKKLPSANVEVSARLSREQELRALEVMVNTDDPFDRERQLNARQSAQTLRVVAEWLGQIRGRRKTLVFISEGYDYDLSDLIGTAKDPKDVSGLVADVQNAIAAANRANVSIYSIDPRGLAQTSDDAITASTLRTRISSRELMFARSSLRAVAEETGGYAAINTNDLSATFERIVNDSSGYYVLAFSSSVKATDGKFHRLTVRVKTPGLRVVARPGYVAAQRATLAAPTWPDISPTLADALASPLSGGTLITRVFSIPFRGTTATASVLLGIEIEDRQLTVSDGRIELAYLVIDSAGVLRDGSSDSLDLNLTADRAQRARDAGIRILKRLELPPGRYQVRLAVRDARGGPIGSVMHELIVDDFPRQPFAMSDIALSSVASSRMVPARVDEVLQRMLPAIPGSLRKFSPDDEISVFSEIYDNTSATSHAVDILMTVRSASGRLMVRSLEKGNSAELAGAGGRHGYVARFPLQQFTPGTYVLRIEAQSEAGGAFATRETRFTINAR